MQAQKSSKGWGLLFHDSGWILRIHSVRHLLKLFTLSIIVINDDIKKVD